MAIPVALTLALTSTSSVLAQGMSGKMDSGRMSGPGYETSQDMQRYREMSGLMRDMSQQMNKMQTAMAKGTMSADQQKRMQQQLKEMSELMTRMAGLQDRPSMNDSESKRQAEEMRKQMDKMMRANP